jgi:hypothetical protein
MSACGGRESYRDPEIARLSVLFCVRLISSSLFVGASPVPVQGQRAACRHITRTTSDDEDYDDVDDDDGDVSATSLLLLLSWWFSRLWLVL